MPKAQVIHKKGPPSCMQWEEWDVPDPSFGEVRIRHTAIGVQTTQILIIRAGISHLGLYPRNLLLLDLKE